MDHINLFQTNAEFLSAYTNDYAEPWVSFTMETSGLSYNKGTTPPVPSHDYIEIGGIKWATMNLGATAVTDYGKYYAWGDISGYTASQVGVDKDFGEEDYVYGPYDWSSEPDYGLTKYNSQDGKTVLEPVNDAVQTEWGGSWRMPTLTDWQTLFEAVNTAWTTDYQGSGISGAVCTDKTDSTKVLFFPAAGFAQKGPSDEKGYIESPGEYIEYWSASLNTEEHDCAFGVFGGESYVDPANFISRCYGLSIRGILDD
jgi:uncharacterized protein (TIGR02145 family)